MKTQSIIRSISMLFFLCLYLITTAQEDVTFIGVWRTGRTAQMLLPNKLLKKYAQNKEITKEKGFPRLADMEIEVFGRSRLHQTWSVWERSRVATTTRNGYWQDIMRAIPRLERIGYKLIDIEPYISLRKNPRKYFATFQKSSAKTSIYELESWTEVYKKVKRLIKQGMCLVDIERNNGRYIGIWKKMKRKNYIWKANSWSAFVRKWKEYGKKNLRLIDIEILGSRGRPYYVGIWIGGKDGYYLWNVKGYSNFNKKFEELKKKGFRLVDLEVVR